MILNSIRTNLRPIVKDVLWRGESLLGRLNPVNITRVCFFYLPEVPDFGPDFLYFKLGKKETIENPHGYEILFESDMAMNISANNRQLMDYTGLYALRLNNIVATKYMLLIHYDTEILKAYWRPVIETAVRRKSVVFSTWGIDQERSDISRWVYERIDDAFCAVKGRTFLSYFREYGLTRLPNSSQFACETTTFHRLMEFLEPFYSLVLADPNLNWRHAHLLERAWGLFFAIDGYRAMRVIKDRHSQAGDDQHASIETGVLSRALAMSASKFADVL